MSKTTAKKDRTVKRFVPQWVEAAVPERGHDQRGRTVRKRVEWREAASSLILRVGRDGKFWVARVRVGSVPKDADGSPGKDTRKHQRFVYGRATHDNIAAAREWANKLVDQAKAGIDPKKAMAEASAARAQAEADAERLKWENVADDYIEHYASTLRTSSEIKRRLDVYVTPLWRGRNIRSIDRDDIKTLRHKIKSGLIEHDGDLIGTSIVANRVMATVQSLCGWYAEGDKHFVMPFVLGSRSKSKTPEKQRTRVLSDDELRAFWQATGAHTVEPMRTFCAAARLMLLSGCRRDEVLAIRRSEIKGDVWTIPAERHKGRNDQAFPHEVPLTPAMQEIIDAQPKFEKSDLVFTLNGRNPVSNIARLTDALRESMLVILRLQEFESGDWTLHDLRRTAATRANSNKCGVRLDIVERMLGHKPKGPYNQHDYRDEKRDGFERLAAHIARVIEPPPANVVPLRAMAAE